MIVNYNDNNAENKKINHMDTAQTDLGQAWTQIYLI